MREEVQTIMGDKGFVEFSDLHNLHKLTAFIKECMRLRTPAPGMIPRRAKITHYIKDIKI
jgi:cytochrome P450